METKTKELHLSPEDMKTFVIDYLSSIKAFDKDIKDSCVKVAEYICKDNVSQRDIVERLRMIITAVTSGVSAIGTTKDYQLVVLSKQDVNITLKTRRNGKYLIAIFNIVNDSDKELVNAKFFIEKIPEIQIVNEVSAITVPPHTSKSVEFAFTLVTPLFSEIRFQFSSSLFDEISSLPINFTHFAINSKMSEKDFMVKWNKLTNPMKSCSFEVAKLKNNKIQSEGTAAVLFGMDGIKVLPNRNVICAKDIITSNGTHGFLVRVFEEFGVVKIQCRCSSKEVADAINKCIKKFSEPTYQIT
jgi:hypothetical protein